MTHRRPFIALFTALLLAAGCDGAPSATTQATGPQPQTLPTIQLAINGAPLTIQIADEESEREKGLMYTRQMPADHGMIFVFPGETELGFWMRNTPIDLDIVYVDYRNKVVSVKTMKAYDLSNVPSDGPATYAIELNAGVAAKLKIVAGQQIDIPSALLQNAK